MPPSHKYADVSVANKRFFNRTRYDYVIPDLKFIRQFGIVVTTLIDTVCLLRINVRPGHFSHVFIDESACATESETLCGIAQIICKTIGNDLTGQIVLAGDPRQPGPFIHSRLAKTHGFGKSYYPTVSTRTLELL